MNRKVTKKYLIDSFVSVKFHTLHVEDLFPDDIKVASGSLKAIEDEINGSSSRYQCISMTGQVYMDIIRASKHQHIKVVEETMRSITEMLRDPSTPKEAKKTLNLFEECVMKQKLETRISILSFYTSTKKNERFTLKIENQLIECVTPAFVIFTKPESTSEFALDLALSELYTLISITANQLREENFSISPKVTFFDVKNVRFYNNVILNDQPVAIGKANRFLNIELFDKAQYFCRFISMLKVPLVTRLDVSAVNARIEVDVVDRICVFRVKKDLLAIEETNSFNMSNEDVEVSEEELVQSVNLSTPGGATIKQITKLLADHRDEWNRRWNEDRDEWNKRWNEDRDEWNKRWNQDRAEAKQRDEKIMALIDKVGTILNDVKDSLDRVNEKLKPDVKVAKPSFDAFHFQRNKKRGL